MSNILGINAKVLRQKWYLRKSGEVQYGWSRGVRDEFMHVSEVRGNSGGEGDCRALEIHHKDFGFYFE